MGTYYGLDIDGIELFSVKGDLNPYLFTIFREHDKYTSIEYINEGDGYIYEKPIFRYISTGKIVQKRLEIMGFNLSKIENSYNKRVQFLNNTEFETLDGSIDITFQQLLDNLESHLLLCKEFKLDYKKFLENRDYIEDSLLYFGDVRELIYCLLSFIDDQAHIEYDITEMGFDKEENICTRYVNDLINDFHINEKTLVITEGKTDIEFLKQSLRILFPEYYDFYSFLDFDLGNIGGSVSSIEKIIQGFIGSGIKNRIVVLFDNDVAGRHGILNLGKILVPDNIKILQYPNVEVGKNYPTIGPGGIEYLDINGLAGGIELYLGKDVLFQNGSFELIQWRGYDEKLRKYQGSFLNKEEIHERFRKKLTSKESITPENSPELIKIFEVLFKAFI